MSKVLSPLCWERPLIFKPSATLTCQFTEDLLWFLHVKVARFTLVVSRDCQKCFWHFIRHAFHVLAIKALKGTSKVLQSLQEIQMPEQNFFFFLHKTISWNTITPKRLFPSIPQWPLIALSHVLCYLYVTLHICYQMQDVIITPSWCALAHFSGFLSGIKSWLPFTHGHHGSYV